ncbi:cell division protein SepF [Streptococcus suis]|uniref:Cell division protein SepF n=1 Tax=Streptococcus suis TaxID=1307 RepID=A0A4T2GV23_STRSU|nr:cell division protein SepF [Streptococcus suis]MBY4635287.1 cell division protein SepF [Streptococcus suis]MCK3958946.1 cell division protein SepF [Streptococcus suis]MDD7565348.1 cell division protein SepF [Streptococcus suis]MDY5054179.1 cell division protein SepF [Streptococcus suis]NQJ86339.1 cell division protein SepF [Streptococcus suis]
MALKDTFKNLFNYFEVDEVNEVEEQADAYSMPNDRPKMRVANTTIAAPVREQQPKVETRREARSESQLQRLHERQQELMTNNNEKEIVKTTIDIKFPKRYEDAPEMVNLLLDNASILIDFQYMSEQQARRCLDYLDGARSVLSGNLKKVSNTMWLLTPVNVTVNIEELRNANAGTTTGAADSNFDFDIKR